MECHIRKQNRERCCFFAVYHGFIVVLKQSIADHLIRKEKGPQQGCTARPKDISRYLTQEVGIECFDKFSKGPLTCLGREIFKA